MEVNSKFEFFITDLKNRLNNELPGDLAHQKMMSYNRPLASEVKKNKAYRESAVLILFYPNKALMTCLTNNPLSSKMSMKWQKL